MNLTWHIIRKDLVRFRRLLIGWTVFMAAKYLFFAKISGVLGAVSPGGLRWLDINSPLFFVNSACDPVIAFILVAALVFEDHPAGRDPFWVTRPISGMRLLVAKFLGAVLMFVVLPVAVAVPWWWACGFDSAQIISAATIDAEIFGLVVLVGLACASVVDGYPRYFVWTIVGLAVLLAAFGFASIVHTPRQLQMVWLVACVTLVAAQIVCHRFVSRHFRATLGLLAAVTVAGCALLFSAAPEKFDHWMEAPAPTIPGEDMISVKVAGEIQAFARGGIALPLRVDALPENVVPILRLAATWRADDGKVWTMHGGAVGNRHAFRRTIRHMLGLPVAERDTPDELISFSMPLRISQRILAESTSVEGTVDGYIFEAQLLAEMPLQENARRVDGGGLTISNLTKQKGEVTFILSARTAEQLQTGIRDGYIALVNRRTGEIIEPSSTERIAASPIPQFNQVFVTCVGLRFLVPNADWTDDATFVVAATRHLHPFHRPVAAYRRTTFAPVPFDPSSFPVSTDVLRQYAGVYQATPAATVKLMVDQDHLVTKGPQFGMKIGLFPTSENAFFSPHVGWFTVTNGGFTLEFQRDAGGAVSGFVVHQNGRDYVVPRVVEKK